jgi:hypothetical protein
MNIYLKYFLASIVLIAIAVIIIVVSVKKNENFDINILQSRSVPNVVGLSKNQAIQTILNNNLVYAINETLLQPVDVRTKLNKVLSQMPQPGDMGSIVQINVGVFKVPSVIGLSYNDASRTLSQQGLNFSFGGNKITNIESQNNKVVIQQPVQGSNYESDIKLFIGQYIKPDLEEEKKYVIDLKVNPKDVPTNIKNVVNRLQGKDDKYRFSVPRPWRDVITLRTGSIVNDVEYDWSDNVFGLCASKNSYYIAVDDRKRLQKTPIKADETFGEPQAIPGSGNEFNLFGGEPDYSYPRTYYCSKGKFGQAHTLFTQEDYTITPLKGCKSKNKNGSYLENRYEGRPNPATAIFLKDLQIDWVAFDPKSQFYFVSPTGQSLSKVRALDLVYSDFDYDSATAGVARTVRDIPLRNNNKDFTLNNAVAACFSKNGIFYVLCDGNREQASGVWVFWLHYTGNYFQLVDIITVQKAASSTVLGVSVGDSQKLVGVTCRDMGTYNNLYVLYLNNDVVSTDNISLIKFQNVW